MSTQVRAGVRGQPGRETPAIGGGGCGQKAWSVPAGSRGPSVTTGPPLPPPALPSSRSIITFGSEVGPWCCRAAHTKSRDEKPPRGSEARLALGCGREASAGSLAAASARPPGAGRVAAGAYRHRPHPPPPPLARTVPCPVPLRGADLISGPGRSPSGTEWSTQEEGSPCKPKEENQDLSLQAQEEKAGCVGSGVDLLVCGWSRSDI